MILETVKVSA